MGNSVYKINKGINKSVEFKGLKAQYIWYLGGGIVLLLLLFAVMYIMGINQYLCMAIVLLLGGLLVSKVYSLSHKYGAYGLMKKMARLKVPKVIKSYNRQSFFRKGKS